MMREQPSPKLRTLLRTSRLRHRLHNGWCRPTPDKLWDEICNGRITNADTIRLLEQEVAQFPERPETE